jgi:folate-dependent phosphoribosylglycinamide formyltransferase PurN
MRIAVVSNGNFFSTVELGPVLKAPDMHIAGVVVMGVPPGRGNRLQRLARLARRTGYRFALYKLASLVLPKLYAALTRRPMFLDQLCASLGVPHIDVDDVNAEASRRFLERAKPDVLVSVSCPQIIKPHILNVARVAAINVHQSLLPAYAGMAPYFWVLRNGERTTGLTVHVMTPEVDMGPVLRQREVDVLPGDTALGLQLRLVRVGAEELLGALRDIPGSLSQVAPQELSTRSFNGWPTRHDVRILLERGRRLATLQNFGTLFREGLDGRRRSPDT